MSPLSILVIHHHTPELLETCLTRLARHAPAARVWVIDSSSQGHYANYTQRLLKNHFPQMSALHVRNHSLAGAVNSGLKHALTHSASPLVAHMNADVLVEADTFAALRHAFNDPRVGMAGPLGYTPAGKPQPLGPLYRLHYQRLYHARQNQVRVQVRVPWLSGCLQVVRREAVLRVGGMDSSLRFYNEDIEWCLRLRRAGYRCVLVDTPVLHIGGSATPKQSAFLVEGYRGGYRLSQRYGGRQQRVWHRRAVLLAARLQARMARESHEREAYHEIATMFQRAQFDASPFGVTLNEHHPGLTPSG